MSILPRGNLEIAASVVQHKGLPGHKAQVLRVLEDDNFIGQKLVDQSASAAEFSRGPRVEGVCCWALLRLGSSLV